ncbi:MAG: prenyltransferase [Deltaproteobacteria bacterium]|nr:prenyltransferase [Deltaproteobacteria bacterium]
MSSGFGRTVHTWLRAMGLYRGFLVVSLIPVSTGAAAAYAAVGEFRFGMFGLALLAAWCFHAGANLLNDYYDHVSGTDDINTVRTPFSGGTRVIQEGLLPAGSLRTGGWIAYALGVPILLYLTTASGPFVLVLAAVGGLSGVMYTWRPVWLCYRGVGEILIGLNFGPVLAAFGAYTQAGHVPQSALVAGVALGFFAAAIITINEVPDLEADRAVGKKNLVVRFGPKTGLAIWSAFLWGAVAVFLVGVYFGALPPRTFIAAPIVLGIVALTRRRETRLENLDALVAACRLTILSMTGFWILLATGFVLSAGVS